MTKKFFTRVSPKAVDGIRRVYEGEGYEVRAKVASDGSITVVVAREEPATNSSRGGFLRRRGRRMNVAA